jgi:hypothetical protein
MEQAFAFIRMARRTTLQDQKFYVWSFDFWLENIHENDPATYPPHNLANKALI